MQKKHPIIQMKFFPMQSATEILHVALNQKLKLPHRKINQSLRTLSYIGTSLWNNQDKLLKTSTSLNTSKHNINDYFFRKKILKKA